jgi:uncharacterized protein
VSILEKVREDANAALKAGERQRASALRLVADALQQDAKLGRGDELAVLQRERKKRLEAAEAYRDAGREDQAASEQAEADAIESYLPEQLSDEELADLVAAAIDETGATEQKDMGKVMGTLMPRVGGKADGKRVSQAVREALGA